MEKTRHGKYGRSRGRRKNKGESTLCALKRGRSGSQAIGEPRRPHRHNVVTNPTRRTNGEDICVSDGDFDRVGEKKSVVAPPTQTHKGLPIRSWLKAPGTPYDQIVGYLSEDATRTYDALAEIRKWREFLGGPRDNPVDLAV